MKHVPLPSMLIISAVFGFFFDASATKIKSLYASSSGEFSATTISIQIYLILSGEEQMQRGAVSNYAIHLISHRIP